MSPAPSPSPFPSPHQTPIPPLDPPPPPPDKEDKEELTTLPMLQGTSHCSCVEHCFLLVHVVALRRTTRPV